MIRSQKSVLLLELERLYESFSVRLKNLGSPFSQARGIESEKILYLRIALNPGGLCSVLGKFMFLRPEIVSIEGFDFYEKSRHVDFQFSRAPILLFKRERLSESCMIFASWGRSAFPALSPRQGRQNSILLNFYTTVPKFWCHKKPVPQC